MTAPLAALAAFLMGVLLLVLTLDPAPAALADLPAFLMEATRVVDAGFFFLAGDRLFFWMGVASPS
jgi:hypothetical protein